MLSTNGLLMQRSFACGHCLLGNCLLAFFAETMKMPAGTSCGSALAVQLNESRQV